MQRGKNPAQNEKRIFGKSLIEAKPINPHFMLPYVFSYSRLAIKTHISLLKPGAEHIMRGINLSLKTSQLRMTSI